MRAGAGLNVRFGQNAGRWLLEREGAYLSAADYRGGNSAKWPAGQ